MFQGRKNQYCENDYTIKSIYRFNAISIKLEASLVAQMVKRLSTMRETPVRFLGWKDPLEKGKATHSSILAWRIPWGHKESDTTEQPSRSKLV